MTEEQYQDLKVEKLIKQKELADIDAQLRSYEMQIQITAVQEELVKIRAIKAEKDK